MRNVSWAASLQGRAGQLGAGVVGGADGQFLAGDVWADEAVELLDRALDPFHVALGAHLGEFLLG